MILPSKKCAADRRKALQLPGSSLLLQFPEPEVKDDLFFFGQLHPFNQGNQHLPVGGGGSQKAFHQFFGQIILPFWREVRPVDLGEARLQRGPVCLDLPVDPLEICLVQQAGQLRLAVRFPRRKIKH